MSCTQVGADPEEEDVIVGVVDQDDASVVSDFPEMDFDEYDDEDSMFSLLNDEGDVSERGEDKQLLDQSFSCYKNLKVTKNVNSVLEESFSIQPGSEAPLAAGVLEQSISDMGILEKWSKHGNTKNADLSFSQLKVGMKYSGGTVEKKKESLSNGLSRINRRVRKNKKDDDNDCDEEGSVTSSTSQLSESSLLAKRKKIFKKLEEEKDQDSLLNVLAKVKHVNDEETRKTTEKLMQTQAKTVSKNRRKGREEKSKAHGSKESMSSSASHSPNAHGADGKENMALDQSDRGSMCRSKHGTDKSTANAGDRRQGRRNSTSRSGDEAAPHGGRAERRGSATSVSSQRQGGRYVYDASLGHTGNGRANRFRSHGEKSHGTCLSRSNHVKEYNTCDYEQGGESGYEEMPQPDSQDVYEYDTAMDSAPRKIALKSSRRASAGGENPFLQAHQRTSRRASTGAAIGNIATGYPMPSPSPQTASRRQSAGGAVPSFKDGRAERRGKNRRTSLSKSNHVSEYNTYDCVDEPYYGYYQEHGEEAQGTYSDESYGYEAYMNRESADGHGHHDYEYGYERRSNEESYERTGGRESGRRGSVSRSYDYDTTADPTATPKTCSKKMSRRASSGGQNPFLQAHQKASRRASTGAAVNNIDPTPSTPVSASVSSRRLSMGNVTPSYRSGGDSPAKKSFPKAPRRASIEGNVSEDDLDIEETQSAEKASRRSSAGGGLQWVPLVSPGTCRKSDDGRKQEPRASRRASTGGGVVMTPNTSDGRRKRSERRLSTEGGGSRRAVAAA